MALSPAQQITQLYIGYFHRAPDPEGLNYWIGRLTDTVDPMTITQIAQSFSEQPEALDTYAFLRAPDVASADAFITQIYSNLFNRAPDAEGFAYWKGRLESGEIAIGDFIASVTGGATNSAAGQDVTTLANKVTVGLYYAEEVLENNVEWSLASARSAIDGVTSSDATVVAAKLWVDQFIADANADVFQLTVDTDVATANVFDAGLAYTPGGNDRVNTLQDEDVLTGRGDNPTLNATLGNANDNGGQTITPTLNGIETVNVRFTGSQGSAGGAVHTLDLQDATGVDAVNITGITDPNNNVRIQNLTSVPAELSLANTQSPAGSVGFTFTRAAVAGAADQTTLTVSNVVVNDLIVEENAVSPVEGVETINLVSAGSANDIGTLWVEELETLNVSGDQNLKLGDDTEVRGPNNRVEALRYEAGLGNVAGSLETINVSALNADFNIVLGGEVNAPKDGTSGVPVEFRYTGAQGADTVVLTAGVQATSNVILDGGEGENTLVTLQSIQNGAYNKFQNLEVRGQNNTFNVAGRQQIEVDTALIADLKTVTIRNEGQRIDVNGNLVNGSNYLRTDLTNVNADVAKNITVLHGTTNGIFGGNNALAGNQINVTTVAAATTVGLTIEDGVNTDPRFNVQLNTSSNVRNIELNDNDTESNTVQLGGLNAVGDAVRGNVAHLTGTVTVTGGRAGNFLNLDASGATNGGAYGYNTTGADSSISGAYGSFTDIVADTDAANPAIAAAIVAGRLPAGTQPNARDTAVETVLRSVNAAPNDLLRASKIEASEQVSDLIVRLGESNVDAKLGSGNDTVIFAVRHGDPADNTASTSGLTAADKINGGEGTDTIVLDGNGTNLLGASEWSNLTGIDVIRLAGTAGTDFTLHITNQFVEQTDAGNRITIINNDGDLTTGAENVATINLRPITTPNNNVTFIGANGDGSDGIAARAVQTLVLNDQTADAGNILNGGDNDIITDYTSVGSNGQFSNAAASNAWWAANANIAGLNTNAAGGASADGNNNVLQIFNTAQVTVADLANVKNFSTIEFRNDLAAVQTLNLTLDNATADALVDASHTATAAQRETLLIRAIDNDVLPAARAQLNLTADSLSNAFNVNVVAGRGTNNIATGAGNDTVVLLGNYNVNYGIDAVTGFDVGAYQTGINGNFAVNALAVTGSINLGAGNNEIRSYGAVDLTAVGFGVLTGALNITAASAVVLTDAQFNAIIASTGKITFVGGQNHELRIVPANPASPLTVDLSGVVLEGTGDLAITLDGGVDYSGEPQDNGTGEVTIGGETLPVTVAEFLAAIANNEAGPFNIVDTGNAVVLSLDALVANVLEINKLNVTAEPANALTSAQFTQWADLDNNVAGGITTPVSVNAAGATALQVTDIFDNLDLIKEGGLGNLALTPAQLTELAAIADGVADLDVALQDNGGLTLVPANAAPLSLAQFTTLTELSANLGADPAVVLNANAATVDQVSVILDNLELIGADALTNLTLPVETFNGLNGDQKADLAEALGLNGLKVDGTAEANTIDLSFLDNSGATVWAQGGADTLTASDGKDTFIQGTVDSHSITDKDLSLVGPVWNRGLGFTTGDTLTFGIGLDIINDFTGGAGGDVLDLNVGTQAQSALDRKADALTAGQNWFLSGNLDADGVFHIVANGAVGSSTLILQGYAGLGTNIDTNGSAILLVGVESTELTVANFI